MATKVKVRAAFDDAVVHARRVLRKKREELKFARSQGIQAHINMKKSQLVTAEKKFLRTVNKHKGRKPVKV